MDSATHSFSASSSVCLSVYLALSLARARSFCRSPWPAGLEDQLLEIVVNKEQTALEERRRGLVRAINDYMVSLTDLETEILTRLMDAPADILSDVVRVLNLEARRSNACANSSTFSHLRFTLLASSRLVSPRLGSACVQTLIEGLERTKLKATEIEVKVAQSREQEITINVARNEFRPVAAEGAWIYFLLIQLNIVDYMYQYSLDAFISFFLKAMNKAPKANTTQVGEGEKRQARFASIFF